jgi:hypothetical protein
MSSRRRDVALFGLGFSAGVLVCAMVFTGRSIAPAATPEAAVVLLEEAVAGASAPRQTAWRGAKPMDPPVLPRIFNALNVKISEDDLKATLDLLIDTPNATVSAHTQWPSRRRDRPAAAWPVVTVSCAVHASVSLAGG